MKVAYVVSQYPMRSLTFIRREMAALRALGVDIHTYSLRKCPPQEVLDEDDRREFRDTWSVFPVSAAWFAKAHLQALLTAPLGYLRTLRLAVRCRPPGLDGFARAIAWFAEGVSLAHRLRQDGVDRIHVHFGNAGTHVVNCAASLLGLPWGVSYHGTADFDHPVVASLHWQIARAAFVRCISWYTLSQAMRLAPASCWPRLFVAYSGLQDPQALVRREPSRAPARPRLIAVGRLSGEKGQRLLLGAAARLKAGGHAFSVVVVGDGPDRRDLEAMAAASGIAADCEFTGAVTESEVYRLMAGCDVLVCPSLMEGLPQVLMEAMAVGLPVVAPRVAGIPELVEDGVTGLLYTPGCEQALVEAIARVLRDPQLYQRLVDNGRARVLQDFDMRETVRPLYERIRGMRATPVPPLAGQPAP